MQSHSENTSVFDIFKIGVGPSSSHTLGPWRAAMLFVQLLQDKGILQQVKNIQILLYGSLAKTGVGHGTNIAVQLGLQNADPVTFPVEDINTNLSEIASTKILQLANKYPIAFNPDTDIVFLYEESLPYHPNALTFCATVNADVQIAKTYYSVGGGFVETEDKEPVVGKAAIQFPFIIEDSNELLLHCIKTGLSIHEIVLENENAWRPEQETKQGV